nr:hypothetical protein [Tanacetum cinerariifolium]
MRVLEEVSGSSRSLVTIRVAEVLIVGYEHVVMNCGSVGNRISSMTKALLNLSIKITKLSMFSLSERLKADSTIRVNQVPSGLHLTLYTNFLLIRVFPGGAFVKEFGCFVVAKVGVMVFKRNVDVDILGDGFVVGEGMVVDESVLVDVIDDRPILMLVLDGGSIWMLVLGGGSVLMVVLDGKLMLGEDGEIAGNEECSWIGVGVFGIGVGVLVLVFGKGEFECGLICKENYDS